jgi:hypothetical protein
MHLHGNANRHVRENARCNAAMQIGHNAAVILRCSPFFTASLEGWIQAPAAILRDAAQARGSSG